MRRDKKEKCSILFSYKKKNDPGVWGKRREKTKVLWTKVKMVCEKKEKERRREIRLLAIASSICVYSGKAESGFRIDFSQGNRQMSLYVHKSVLCCFFFNVFWHIHNTLTFFYFSPLRIHSRNSFFFFIYFSR